VCEVVWERAAMREREREDTRGRKDKGSIWEVVPTQDEEGMVLNR